MEDAVKTPPVAGGRRAEQARATRRRIVEQATRLFTQKGYAATTLEQIAAGAGVALQTVYFHFGNKRGLLKVVVDVASVGDDQPVPLLERPAVGGVRSESDAEAAVARWVELCRDVFARVAPVMRVVRDAAGSDPEMATQWQTNRQQTLTAHRVLAEKLHDLHVLRPGMTTAKATDVIYGLVSLELYLLFTDERGWSADRWQDWVNETLARAILA
jgi:AcrR family transcriptional regulator